MAQVIGSDFPGFLDVVEATALFLRFGLHLIWPDSLAGRSNCIVEVNPLGHSLRVFARSCHFEKGEGGACAGEAEPEYPCENLAMAITAGQDQHKEGTDYGTGRKTT